MVKKFYRFEARDEYGRWSSEAAGSASNVSYAFSSTDIDMALVSLADALECSRSEVRAVEVEQ